MIIEQGRVAAVEAQGVWVDAVQKSVCSGCQVRQGCGQGLLSKYSASGGYLWVITEGSNRVFTVGDEIQFGLPDDVIVKSSLMLYMMPLAALILGALAMHAIWPSDAAAGLGGVLGLLLGAFLVRQHAKSTRLNPRYQPQLVISVNAVPEGAACGPAHVH